MDNSKASLIKSLEVLNKEDNCLLLWTARPDDENQRSLLFSRPKDIIVCSSLSEVVPCMKKIENYISRKYYAAGYIAYEAGFAFEESLERFFIPGPLLLWFGIYRKPAVIESRFNTFENTGRQDKKSAADYELRPRGLSVDKDKYVSCVKKIKNYIASGMTYQVNYTIKKYFRFSGNPYSLFLDLCNRQRVPYAAFIKNDYEYILSFSPELFLKYDNGQITVKPMKGTIGRGKEALKDFAGAITLRDSRKDRAENLMIVDLLRNDLGRISKIGSVKTKSLFDVQRFETLWQMTSTVSSRLEKKLNWLEIFKNTFPSGSVTGAPKIKTMELIAKLEAASRGVYTGSIGYVSADKSAVFNVAIRTLRIDRETKEGELGIGSGIVWDSKPQKEWQECQLKGDFLKTCSCGFELIETMALRKGVIKLLDYHLDRLEESALYFDFNFNRKKASLQIKRFMGKLNPRCDYKLRLLLFKDGHIDISRQPLPAVSAERKRIVFSKNIVDSRDVFLYHKTTRRALYNQEHEFWRRRGFFDCIFKNERNEVTEGSISNIFIEKDSQLFTPPVSCGLLNGVFRRHLLDGSRREIKERVLFEADLESANKIYLTNAVSGIITVQFAKIPKH